MYNVPSSTPTPIPYTRLLNLLEWLEMCKRKCIAPIPSPHPFHFKTPAREHRALGLERGQKITGKIEDVPRKYLLNWLFPTQVHWTHHIRYLGLSGCIQFLYPSYFCLTSFQPGPEPGSVYQPEQKCIQTHLWDVWQDHIWILLLRSIFMLLHFPWITSCIWPLPHPGIFNGSLLTLGLIPNFSARYFTTPYHSNTTHVGHV